MMVAETGAGYVTGSMALLADGFHMATHAGDWGLQRLPTPMQSVMPPRSLKNSGPAIEEI